MIERPVPWWRRALTVAFDGIRSGFGLFRRNGKAAGPEVAVKVDGAAHVREAERDKTELQEEESRVKPSSPNPGPADAQEPTAVKESVAVNEESSAKVAVPVEPEPVPERPALAVRKDQHSADQQEVPVHDFSRDVSSAQSSGALAPAAGLPIADSEIPSESQATEEPAATSPALVEETTQIAETASAEDVSETAEIRAEAAPEVTNTPEPAEEVAETRVRDPERPAVTDSESEPKPPVTEPPTTPDPPEPEPPPLPVPEPPPAPPVTEPPGPDPLPAPVPIDVAPTLPFAEKPERTTAEKVAAALKARGEDAEQSPFSVIVNQVYDGPLDLLLDLIRKQDIDIYDIPIAKITAQFLAYVDQLRASDMDVAGDFIYTAALLIHIKSKMLLPRAPAGPDDAAEDPRRELVERLLEHERFKNAAQMLLERQMLEAASWTNPGIREFQEDAGAEPEIAADTTDLVRVFGGILERARNRPILNLEEDSVTVGQMIQFLTRRLTMEDKPVALRRMLSHTKSERALIAMFLALLELVRLQAILLRQDCQFSEIFIKKHSGFDALMNQGLASARDDWR